MSASPTPEDVTEMGAGADEVQPSSVSSVSVTVNGVAVEGRARSVRLLVRVALKMQKGPSQESSVKVACSTGVSVGALAASSVLLAAPHPTSAYANPARVMTASSLEINLSRNILSYLTTELRSEQELKNVLRNEKPPLHCEA